MIKKIWWKFWGWIKPYLTPRMIPIVLTLWLIFNGVWYVLAFAHLGQPTWLIDAAKVYLIFIWAGTPEKLLYLPIAMLIYRLIYREKFVKKEV